MYREDRIRPQGRTILSQAKTITNEELNKAFEEIEKLDIKITDWSGWFIINGYKYVKNEDGSVSRYKIAEINTLGKSIKEQWDDIHKFLLENPKTHIVWKYSCPACEEPVDYEVNRITLKCDKCGWDELKGIK